MGELKTKVTNASPTDFINKTTTGTKKDDAFTLLKLYQKITGEKPKMWGPSIIGYGMYHYKSERSTQEGDWPIAAFSPRKQSLTLYVMGALDDKALIDKLGKCKTSKGCLYINKLEDVDMKVLEQIIRKSLAFAREMYPEA